MKKRIVLITTLLLIAVVGILVGVFYPDKNINKPKKIDNKCSISLKDKYYDVKYDSTYEDYSVVAGIYKVIDSKDKLDKILNKIGCDNSVNVDFSKKNIVLLETLVDPKINTMDIKDDSMKTIILYKTIDDANKKDTYNLFLVPVSKNVKNYDIRISPKVDPTEKGPGEIVE